MLKRRKAQSTIEYVVIFTAVLMVLLIFMLGAPPDDDSAFAPAPAPTGTGTPVPMGTPLPPSGPSDYSGYQGKLNEVYNAGAERMVNNAVGFYESLLNHPAAPAN